MIPDFKMMPGLRCCASAAFCIAALALPLSASATVYGFLGNFDVVNDTGKTAHGFEIDLEGLHSSDITDTFGGTGRGFPTTVERYGAPTIAEYSSGGTFGVKVTYHGSYSGGSWDVGTPSGVFSTPGESCWTGGGIGYGPSTPCDHFGVGTSAAAAKTTYSWLLEDTPGSGTLVNSVTNLPAPMWIVTPPPPPAPGAPPAPPVVVAQVQAPPPGEKDGEPQFGTPVWVKVFTTEFDGPVALEDLMGGDPKVKEAEKNTEVEWQLLQTDPGNPASGILENGGEAGADAEAVLRRYEFYKYIGLLDPISNEAMPLISDSMADPSEIGDFIGAQNGAVNLLGVFVAPVAGIPEPDNVALGLVGLAGLAVGRWRRRRC